MTRCDLASYLLLAVPARGHPARLHEAGARRRSYKLYKQDLNGWCCKFYSYSKAYSSKYLSNMPYFRILIAQFLIEYPPIGPITRYFNALSTQYLTRIGTYSSLRFPTLELSTWPLTGAQYA